MRWHKLYQFIMVILLVNLISIHHVYAMYRNVQGGLNDNNNLRGLNKDSAFFKLLSIPGGLKIYQVLYDSKELDKKKREELADKYLHSLRESIQYNVEEITRLAGNLKQDISDFSYNERKKKESRLKEKATTVAALQGVYDGASVSNENTQPYHADKDHEFALALGASVSAPESLFDSNFLREQVTLLNQATKNGMHSTEIVDVGRCDLESALPSCKCSNLSSIKDGEMSFVDLFNIECKKHVLVDEESGEFSITMYHGTSDNKIDSYQKEGPKLSESGSLGPAYYLTTKISTAKIYARIALKNQDKSSTKDASLNKKGVNPAIIVYSVSFPELLKVLSVKPCEQRNIMVPVLRNKNCPDEFAFRSEAVSQISCNQIWILDKDQ